MNVALKDEERGSKLNRLADKPVILVTQTQNQGTSLHTIQNLQILIPGACFIKHVYKISQVYVS